MKICYVSSYYYPNYIRQRVILEGLEENNIQVLNCIETGKNPLRYLKLFFRFLKLEKKADLIIVGFRGHEILPFIRLLTKKPIIFDAFISIYETLCFDMKKIKYNSVTGSFIYWCEKKILSLPQLILLDTNEQIKYFVKTFHIDSKKFHRVFVGVDNSFYPRKKMNSKKFIVLWYGNYIPLQGAEVIVKAANYLKDEKNIHFKLIGNGQTFDKTKKIAENYKLKNIEFANRVGYFDLPQEIANCDVFLGGHFGRSHKSKSVISGKTFQALAMKVPLIIGENPANKELFSNKKNCLMVKHGDCKKLGEAIILLKTGSKLKNRIRLSAYDLFLNNCKSKVIGKEFVKIFKKVGGE